MTITNGVGAPPVLAATPAAQQGPEHVEQPVAYDAIVLAGFGGPEGQGDVIPFLRNVTRGRGIPIERLEEEALRYLLHCIVIPSHLTNRTHTVGLVHDPR